MKAWQILETAPQSAEQNMSVDRDLLSNLENSNQPILHFYEWEGASATYGHFIDPSHHLNMEAVIRNKLQLGRRPTGGGIIFHLCDFAFSVIVPSSHPNYSLNTLENYAFINLLVAGAVQEFMKGSISPSLLKQGLPFQEDCFRNFCMAQPTKYDLIIDGKKVGGAAQRRTKYGYLHQGSIALAMPSEEFLNDVLMKDQNVLAAMQQHSYSLLGPHWTSEQLQEGKALLRKLLAKHLSLVSMVTFG